MLNWNMPQMLKVPQDDDDGDDDALFTVSNLKHTNGI